MKPLEFDLHGVRVAVAVPAGATRTAIDARLDRMRAAEPGAADIRFEIRTGRPVERPSGAGRPVYPWDVGEASWFDDAGLLFISAGDHTRLLASPASGRVEITTDQVRLDDAWLLARPLLTLPLVEMLKWRGLYSLHAAGVAADGRALLLAGASGSGKSTLSLALARAGLDFIADDMVFLTAGGRVQPFPEQIDVSPESASWFEELRALGDVPADGWPKHRLHVDEVLGARVADAGAPAALVFPSIAGGERSRLEPLSAAAALVELAPNVLLTDPAMAQRHLDVLGELARTTPVYRLFAGTDLERAVVELRALVGA